MLLLLSMMRFFDVKKNSPLFNFDCIVFHLC